MGRTPHPRIAASVPTLGAFCSDQEQLRRTARVSVCSFTENAENDVQAACGSTRSSIAADLGTAAAMELVEGHLKQAERVLAAQHAGVIRVVCQLLGIPGRAAENGAVPCEFDSDSKSPHHHFQRGPSLVIPQSRPLLAGRFSNHLKLTPRQANTNRLTPQQASTSNRLRVPGQAPQEDKPCNSSPNAFGNVEPMDSRKAAPFEVAPAFRNRSFQRYEDLSKYDLGTNFDEFGKDSVVTANHGVDRCRLPVQPPDAAFRAIWDVVCMLLILYDVVMVPFDFFAPERTSFMVAMTWITRLFWTFDIPMSFTSGFITADGTIEMQPAKIAARYMRSWFLLDIVVTTIDWVDGVVGSAMQGKVDTVELTRTTKILRIVRVARLARLAKVEQIVCLLTERLPSVKLVIFISILKLVMLMLFIAHFVACSWYFVGVELRPADREHWNWLQKFEFEHESLDYKYIMSLRWALSQFAGGMDEVTPVSLAEHMFAGIVYICAFWSGTVFLGVMTSHFTQLYILGNQQSQQVIAMRRYLANNGISKALVLRVTRNVKHCLRMQQPGGALMALVSEPLQIEIHYEMYVPKLGCHPFFAEYMSVCPFIVRRICHEAMTMNTFSRDDIIFHFGEAAGEMIIVRSGSLNYFWGTACNETLPEGRWLSEPPLWTRWVHKGVLTAREDSTVFAVNAEIFQAIVNKFELAVFNPGEYAMIFVRRLNRTSTEELTDLPWPKLPDARNPRASHMSPSRLSLISGRLSMRWLGVPTVTGGHVQEAPPDGGPRLYAPRKKRSDEDVVEAYKPTSP